MRTATFSLLIGLSAAAGCHRAPAPAVPAPAAPTEDLSARARADSIEADRRTRADSVAREAARAEAAREAARLARIRAALTDTLIQRVHFAFDRTDIRPEDRTLLARKAAIMAANPMLVLRIAGHADERGSDEYNLALGNRRAASVRTFLLNHGIAPDRFEVVSFGEERPLVVGHEESVWAMNRRGEFTPERGADRLVAPGTTP